MRLQGSVMQLPGNHGTSAQPQYVKHQRGSIGKKMRDILASQAVVTYLCMRNLMQPGRARLLSYGACQVLQAATSA